MGKNCETAHLQLSLDRLDFGSLLDIGYVDGHLAGANIRDIGHVRVLLSHEDSIDFLEGRALGFNPVNNLCFLSVDETSLIEKQVGETYNKDKTDDVPATVDEVHLPCNVGQRDRDAVNKDDSRRLIVRYVYITR